VRDVIFLTVAGGFFVLAALFVRACAVITGREGMNEDQR
jgi:hypothetical protein